MMKFRLKASHIIHCYAAFLFLAGFTGFALAGFQEKARTSIIMGSATAFVISMCANLVNSSHQTLEKIGLRTALILSLVYAGVFAWRASAIIGVPEKEYLLNLLVVMCVGSLIAAAVISQCSLRKKKSS